MADYLTSFNTHRKKMQDELTKLIGSLKEVEKSIRKMPIAEKMTPNDWTQWRADLEKLVGERSQAKGARLKFALGSLQKGADALNKSASHLIANGDKLPTV